VVNVKDESREKVIETLDNYDEKIEKMKKDLKKLTDKRENFFTRTVSDNLKANNITIRDFFKNLDKLKENEENTVSEANSSLSEIENETE